MVASGLHPFAPLWFYGVAVFCELAAAIAYVHEIPWFPKFAGLHPWRSILLLAVPCFAVTAAIHWQQYKSQMPTVITPGNGRTPPIPSGVIIPPYATPIFLGSCVAYTISSRLPAVCYIDPITRHIMTIVEIRHDGSVLLVSATLCDKFGTEICRVSKNCITLNLEQAYEMANTEHSFCVLEKATRKPVLVVEYINPRAMRMLGDFYLPDGELLSITSDSISFGGTRVRRCALEEAGLVLPLDRAGQDTFRSPSRKTAK